MGNLYSLITSLSLHQMKCIFADFNGLPVDFNGLPDGVNFIFGRPLAALASYYQIQVSSERECTIVKKLILRRVCNKPEIS